MTIPRVIIEVSGGLVQVIHSSHPIQVDILDHDNMRQETDKAELERMRDLEEEIEDLEHGYSG